ncbi:MAG: AraC family transcriptional regulator of adaptative response [Alphaproteobacteria bacterium]|jgi:AraC family transcriptional regulator of adaptative response/methylated-DNA-[protein]-cysteine methyltransferase
MATMFAPARFLDTARLKASLAGSPVDYANDQDRWTAVVERDANGDGIFYYAVATTGVYCRPSCAARLAHRENVAFYDTRAEAERAGFRSCKRCRPHETETTGPRAGAAIRFAVGECSLGAILIAATEKGICAILLDDNADALVRDLQDRFPKSQLTGGDTDFEQLVAKVVGFIEAPRLGLDLPLDVRGTAFQQRVWCALREIPAGETASYSAVAKRIGSPKSVRAVAGACAANAIAVAIPCHRVVRNDGELSGYRWGVARKQSLLEREAAS